jgi:protein O-mannosyl-transferase
MPTPPGKSAPEGKTCRENKDFVTSTRGVRFTGGMNAERGHSYFRVIMEKGSQRELIASDRGEWLWGAVLVLAVILVYQPVWRAGYVWDDSVFVLGNSCVVGPLGLKEIWTTGAADICPLVLTTFHVEYALWGTRPLPYHLVTVLFHAACAVVLWRVLRRLRAAGAWFGAALWALHPVGVESVAWITEMKNTESGLFFLLSILFFLRWLKTREVGGRAGAGREYTLTLIFAALAMAGKSSTVILPGVLCLGAWWMEGQWHWRNLAKVAPVFIMSIAASAVSIWTQDLQLTAFNDPQWARTWPQRWAAAGDAVWFYLGKLLWPHPLIVNYPRWEIDPGQWTSYLPLGAVIVVLFVLWLARESWLRPGFFVFAYFLVALLPALGLFDNVIFIYSLVFDHFQYLASMGPLALLGAGMVRLTTMATTERPWLRSALGGAAVLVLGAQSWNRAHVFESEESLWTDTLAKNPNCWLGDNNLGYARLNQGRPDEAAALFAESLRINSNNWIAHGNLGSALALKGRVDEAIGEYRKALALDPEYVEALSNLGVALAQKGKVDEAIGEHQKAVELSPYNAAVHNNLGNAFLLKNQLDDAMAEYRKALDLKHDYAEAENNLGSTLLRAGRIDEAIVHLQKARELYPDVAEVRYNLGSAFFHQGRWDEAIGEFQAALEINPNYGEALYFLGDALARKGETAKAIAQYQKAAQIVPDYAPLRYNLGAALSRLNRVDEAIGQFQKAVEIDPNFALAHNSLGIAFAQKGQMKQAIAEFETFLRLRPGDVNARNNLEKARELARKGAPAK